MEKLEKLRSYPSKVYGYNKEQEWCLLRDDLEEDKIKGGKLNHFIKNYSGGINVNKIHGSIPALKENHYRVLNADIAGDAPKDFIQVYEYDKGKKSILKNWDKHIAKVGHKWYPLESISEHLLNRIGEVLNLNMAFSQLRLIHGQLRFLSKFFLKKDEIMVHGAQIYSTYLLETDDKLVQEIEDNNWARELLTFQVTDQAIQFMFPKQYETIMNHLVQLLVFDAITGNNDRHFYNWAVITDLKGEKTPRFSPIYDSARGLFWNRSEKVIEQKFYEGKGKKIRINQRALEKYLQSSRPKIGWEGWKEKKEINHFQLIANINNHYPQHQNTCKSLTNNVYLHSILKMLDEEFITFYTPKRLKLIKECLKRRFNLLQQLCKSDCYA